MARAKNQIPNRSQLEYMREHIRADFERGLLFWKKCRAGRDIHKPIGCKDSNGYMKCAICYFPCYVHQIMYFLFYGEWPETLIDHENRDRSDNRIENLLLSNHSKNALNSKIWASNTTGVKGVSITQFGQFKVTICGKFYGYYNTLEKAKEVADENYRHIAA